MTSHPFVGPFVVLALVTVALVAVAAWWRASIGRDKPLAAHVLAVWALVILLANIANVFSLGAWTSAGFVAIGVVAASVTLGARFMPLQRSAGASAPAERSARQWPQALFSLAVIAGQMALYLVPLIAMFPEQTLITGNFVCNDSVAHALMTRGLDAMEHQFGYWHYLHHYPNGIHGVARVLQPFMPADTAPVALLPISIWVSSFLGLAVVVLLSNERERTNIASLLIAVSPAAALLLGMSVYLFFIGHMGTLPFVLAAVAMLTSWTFEDVRGRSLALLLLPMAASLATYGLVSASLLGFAIALRGITVAARHGVATLWTDIRRIEPTAVAVALGVLALSLPVLSDMVQGFMSFAGRTGTPGNLPGGFLSPFHITGLWLGGGDYREHLAGAASPMILAALLALQVWAITRARLTAGTLLTIVTFAAPVVATAVLLDSPYINFKYLCLLTAVWVPLAMLGVKRSLPGSSSSPRDRTAAVGLLVILILLVSVPLRSYTHLPALPVHWFNELHIIAADHFSRGPVLVLSREDWFHYYRDGDDSVPLTLYFTQWYDGETMREVLLDDAFRTEGEAFLAERMPGAVSRLDTECPPAVIGGRFRLYDFACLNGTGALP